MLKKLTRRQVLRGAGGLTVALPFLPSLSSDAEAATVRRRLVSFGTKHGGVKAPNMYPGDDVLTNRQVLFGGHEIRWGRLQRSTDGALSRVVRGAKLTDRLAAKPLSRPRAEAFPIEPNVLIDNAASNRFTVIEVNARDRTALLHHLAQALFQSNVTLHSSHVSTYGERAVYTFYVTDLTCDRITGQLRLKSLERRMLDAAAGKDFAGFV